MRIQDGNSPLRYPTSAPTKVAPAPSGEGASRLPFTADQFISSLKQPPTWGPEAAKAELRREKEEEKARWRRMMLILLAGFKPSASGADVLIDVADAKNKERRSNPS